MKKNHIIIAVVVLLAAAAGFFALRGNTPTPESAAKPAPKFYNLGGSPAATSHYPYWVAVGKAIQEAYPEFQITVSESRGALDVSHRIRSGNVVVGNGVSRIDYENYHGTGDFKGEAFDKVRTLWYFDMTYYSFAVSKESGIKSFKELDGKRINTGGTGSALVPITTEIMDKLGVKPLYYDASKQDAADAYGNRQIVGMAGGAPAPDSFVMQLNATLPINLLSFTEEEFALVTEGHPYYHRGIVAANTYSGVDYDVLTLMYAQGCQTTSNLSQEEGYKFVKAVWEEKREIWESILAQGASLDAIDMVLQSAIPIHAGMVQYIKEKGRFSELKPEQIPPEYVDK